MTARVIQFPVERRRGPVVGTAVEDSKNGMVKIELTASPPGVSLVVGPLVGEAWWSRVPQQVSSRHDDRAMWMKIGLNPSLSAKRHRVIALAPEMLGGQMHLFVQTACGRRKPLSILFDDAWSGGDCAACRSRGFR